MDIMVIDRDSLTNQLIASKIGANGHSVVTFQNKNEAFDVLREGTFDCVMLDPLPLSEARPVIFAVWKNLPEDIVKPYILLLSKDATMEAAIESGANDVILKPFSTQDIETKLSNAERLMTISRDLAVEDNAHSGGGMVGKAAFNQLFLSALDRAFRYGERSLIVFVHINNYDEILKAYGAAETATIMTTLDGKITFMRRQSDVVGRLGAARYAIMLQRPQFESEPLDAMNRFSEVLGEFVSTFDEQNKAPRLSLELIEVPQGQLHAARFVPDVQIDMVEGEG